jgi:hypothetical protein
MQTVFHKGFVANNSHGWSYYRFQVPGVEISDGVLAKTTAVPLKSIVPPLA